MPSRSQRSLVMGRHCTESGAAWYVAAMFVLALACAACAPPPPDPEPIATPCSVTDGDTIRCDDERIRLLAIDAPELPEHCRPGRACAPGDPVGSAAALEAAMSARTLTIRRMGKDRYGRTLAVVYADGRSTSCSQLDMGHAIYVARWDEHAFVACECGIASDTLQRR